MYKDKKVMIVGMAKSGISAAKLLLSEGAVVTVYDAKPEAAFSDKLDDLRGKCIFALGADPMPIVENSDMLVLSPGVPTRLPFIRRAYDKSLDVIAEMELGYRFCKGDFVAIGGTNGKTTTTALTGAIFSEAGRNTHVIGNIGLPICEEAKKTQPGDVLVAETAALMLETTKFFRPKAAALLNITEDHQDRFGTMENYAAQKLKVFENQHADDCGVLNFDSPLCRRYAAAVKSRLAWFSVKEEPRVGAFLRNSRIVYRDGERETVICDAESVRIPGMHNLENALAAVCLAMGMGVDKAAIAGALAKFPGVEHRIEFIRELDGIRYINDSKGTNPDSTIRAVRAMTRPTVLILGGFDKHSEFDGLFASFSELIRGAVVIGATAEKIMAAAERAGFKNIKRAPDFYGAIDAAREMCADGYNLLLSPACASWDMFRDYEQRGDMFREYVNGL